MTKTGTKLTWEKFWTFFRGWVTVTLALNAFDNTDDDDDDENNTNNNYYIAESSLYCNSNKWTIQQRINATTTASNTSKGNNNNIDSNIKKHNCLDKQWSSLLFNQRRQKFWQQSKVLNEAYPQSFFVAWRYSNEGHFSLIGLHDLLLCRNPALN